MLLRRSGPLWTLVRRWHIITRLSHMGPPNLLETSVDTMSKLLDKLDRIGRGTPAPMGFGTARRTEKVSSLALVTMIGDQRKGQQGAIAKLGPDGALLDGGASKSNLKKLAASLGDVPWGVKVGELTEESAAGFRDLGCDFLAFEAGNVALAALESTEIAYLLHIQGDMPERQLRAVEDLPVDVVVLELDSLSLPLTLEHLISIASVRVEFSKYILLKIPGTLSPAELMALREAGIDGLVVDASDVTPKDLKDLKERLMALPRRQKGRSARAGAVLPQSMYTLPSGPSHEEEDEDDDFE